jgi:exodeoxyribonuclease V alpha subunit
MSEEEEITGTFDKLIWVSESEPKFLIAAIILNGENCVVRGDADEDELKLGLEYRFYGRWKVHKKHGRQFEFKTFVQSQPHGETGIKKYLQTLPGIGEVAAGIMWSNWGSNSVEMLRTQPHDVADVLPRFTEKQAEIASDILWDNFALEGCKIDLMNVFADRGFPKGIIRSCLNKWGNLATEIIQRNPYVLMALKGVGFLRADRMYLDMGKNPSSIKRQVLCAQYYMQNSKEGHTWSRMSIVKEAIIRDVASADLDVKKAVAVGVRAKKLAMYIDDDECRWIADAQRANAEGIICEYMAKNNYDRWPDLDDLSLSDHQVDQAHIATGKRIGILSGVPGTGKTFTVAKIVQQIINTFCESSVALCAPTGKAAVRMTESLAANGVYLDNPASTIHRLLGCKPMDTGWTFEYNAHNKLPHRFIIIDEASMVETQLLATLLQACSDNTHILLVGDTGQLPPVGHGCPLRDLKKSGIPVGELTEIWRNQGAIVQACKDIKFTGRFDGSKVLDIPNKHNLVVYEGRRPVQQKRMIEKVVGSVIRGGKYDPKWDVQILVAVNDKSEVSRKALNPFLQSMLNPGGEKADNNPFTVGDKLICTKNYWYYSPSEERTFVANGELCEVISVQPNLTVVRLTSPERTVFVPRAITTVDGDTGCDFDFGYAISCHRSQGSEWPIVLVVIDSYAGAKFVCSREWVYTAFSRAKDACLVIGPRSVALDFCKTQAIGKRKTFMVERIHECLQQNQLVKNLTS